MPVPDDIRRIGAVWFAGAPLTVLTRGRVDALLWAEGPWRCVPSPPQCRAEALMWTEGQRRRGPSLPRSRVQALLGAEGQWVRNPGFP